MYFVEMQNHLIRRVDGRTGIITTVAGTGRPGYGGDGGPAIKAQFNRPHSIALDGRGGLFVADIGNHRIRRIDLQTGLVHSVAGDGQKRLPVDGQVAKDRPMLGPRALFVVGDRLWIALREGNSVWRMNLNDGRLKHIAGTGRKGYSGDGGPALRATFNGPKGIAVGPQGNVFVVDTENQAIRRIDRDQGTITTVAGCGRRGGAGDGGPATEAEMGRPHGICVDRDGRVFVGDTLNHRVRVVR
jgi:DNA-binding beta-propeller fold protein YncE